MSNLPSGRCSAVARLRSPRLHPRLRAVERGLPAPAIARFEPRAEQAPEGAQQRPGRRRCDRAPPTPPGSGASGSAEETRTATRSRASRTSSAAAARSQPASWSSLGPSGPAVWTTSRSTGSAVGSGVVRSGRRTFGSWSSARGSIAASVRQGWDPELRAATAAERATPTEIRPSTRARQGIRVPRRGAPPAGRGRFPSARVSTDPGSDLDHGGRATSRTVSWVRCRSTDWSSPSPGPSSPGARPATRASLGFRSTSRRKARARRATRRS